MNTALSMPLDDWASADECHVRTTPVHKADEVGLYMADIQAISGCQRAGSIGCIIIHGRVCVLPAERSDSWG
jgi:hypothetical protein